MRQNPEFGWAAKRLCQQRMHGLTAKGKWEEKRKSRIKWGWFAFFHIFSPPLPILCIDRPTMRWDEKTGTKRTRTEQKFRRRLFMLVSCRQYCEAVLIFENGSLGLIVQSIATVEYTTRSETILINAWGHCEVLKARRSLFIWNAPSSLSPFFPCSVNVWFFNSHQCKHVVKLSTLLLLLLLRLDVTRVLLARSVFCPIHLFVMPSGNSFSYSSSAAVAFCYWDDDFSKHLSHSILRLSVRTYYVHIVSKHPLLLDHLEEKNT